MRLGSLWGGGGVGGGEEDREEWEGRTGKERAGDIYANQYLSQTSFIGQNVPNNVCMPGSARTRRGCLSASRPTIAAVGAHGRKHLSNSLASVRDTLRREAGTGRKEKEGGTG